MAGMRPGRSQVTDGTLPPSMPGIQGILLAGSVAALGVDSDQQEKGR